MVFSLDEKVLQTRETREHLVFLKCGERQSPTAWGSEHSVRAGCMTGRSSDVYVGGTQTTGTDFSLCLFPIHITCCVFQSLCKEPCLGSGQGRRAWHSLVFVLSFKTTISDQMKTTGSSFVLFLSCPSFCFLFLKKEKKEKKHGLKMCLCGSCIPAVHRLGNLCYGHT